jgi:hypothetical protein
MSIELSHPQTQARPRTTSPVLRMRVLVHRGRLDRWLADGRSPARDARLTLRADQLTRPAQRAKLARSLRRALRSLEQPSSRFHTPEAPVDAKSVSVCRHEVNDLVRALTAARSPRVRGVAITRVLITDGGGPLYGSGHPERLRGTLLSALGEL